jgi:type II secretory pathway component HofQ
MHRVSLVVLALCATSVLAAPPAPPPKYVGKKVRVVENGVQVTSILKVISDLSRVNIVLLDEPSPAVLDLKADPKPWDQMLAEVVASTGLAMRREANVVVVGSPAHQRAKVLAACYRGT